MSNFIEKSKKLHAINELKDYWTGAFNPNDPDTARHHLMLSYSLPIINFFEPKNLLSLGDNRGRDAIYVKTNFQNMYCIASDLDCSKIEPAVKDGYIDEVKSIDVENIPYKDDSIDFIIAKESFHHWPRPILGLYEALRVAKYGVILIEPSDNLNKLPDTYPSKNDYHDSYEEVGNYKYQISQRELQKIAWSMYYPAVIARGFNDPYKSPFVLEEYLKEKNYLDDLGFKNERQFNLMMICILKKWDEKIIEKLDPSYDIKTRPLNVHIPDDVL